MSAWISTDSEAISGFRYDEKARTLRVKFASGSVYDYFGASPKLFKQWQEATSKGGFFTAYIRDLLPFRRIK